MKNPNNELPDGNKSENSSYKRHYRICPECDKSFYGKNLRAVYCSDRCKVNFHRKMKRKSDTENPIEVSVIDTELNTLVNELNNKTALINELKQELNKSEVQMQSLEKTISTSQAKYDELLQSLNLLLTQHGKSINVAYPISKSVVSIGTLGLLYQKELRTNFLAWSTLFVAAILSSQIDKSNKNDVTKYYDYSKEIGALQDKLKQTDLHSVKLQVSNLIKEISLKKENINNIEMTIKRIETAIEKVNNDKKAKREMKPIEELKDDDGLIDCRDLDKIALEERFLLPGDLGRFLGKLDRHKLAITLSGEQGSGKTYLAFDLMASFLRADLRALYLSMEEGISDLTREKVALYGLDKLGGKIAENATIADVKRFALKFDVIVIDSWGKIGANANDFNKLREEFPDTIFIAIFQQTSSKSIRGGSAPLYDSSINIETYKNNGNRYAICPKNRYNKEKLKYFIEDRMIKED